MRLQEKYIINNIAQKRKLELYCPMGVSSEFMVQDGYGSGVKMDQYRSEGSSSSR